MIPRDTIERIYATAKIEDVIGDYVSLRRRGANMWGNCPFHDEKTPSFSVSPSKGIYKCFGCGKAGNVVNFIMEYEKCSYADALRTLAKRYHIEIAEKELTQEERDKENERESLFKVNEWANNWFQNQLWNTQEGQAIGISYLVERGLREDIIRKFQIGYSPEKNALYSDAKKSGYQDQFLEKTGLCPMSEHNHEHYDRFRDRVIFPIFTISGKVVAFAGRILRNKEKTGKYVNSPDSAIYSKQNELYGLFQAKSSIAKQQQCYLVEGQMDVISMHQAGVENVVSSGGTSLTQRQVLLLHRLTNNVTILYDGDAAGIHAALRGIDMLLEQGLNIKVVLLPDGEDPDSFSRKMNANDFQQYLKDNQQDFIRFKTNLLLEDANGDPIKKSEVIKNIVTSIAIIPDLITRQVYVKDCSNLLEIREDALLREIQKMRREKYYKTSQPTQQNNEQPVENNTSTTEATSQQKENTTANIGVEQVQSKYDTNIRNLLQVLIKYGNYQFIDGETQTVGEYILSELDADSITFENQLYNDIINDYRQHYRDEGFVSESFFKYHPRADIAQLAISLIQDKYELSRIYGHKNISENIKAEVKLPTDADRLMDVVPHLILELKLTILTEQISFIRQAIKHAQENNNQEQLMQYLQQLQQYEAIRRQICKFLGNRILG